MREPRDPIETATDGSIDLYDVATWEERSWLDRLSTRVHRGLGRVARTVVVLVALVILLAQFAIVGLAIVRTPVVGTFVLLSVVPAFAIVLYVWRVDVTMREPLSLLVMTFVLGILFAGFAAVLNTLSRPFFEYVPFVGLALYFYLIVAPVEEVVKWLAIRLYAFRSDRFDAVLDGAVYGAVAGLGFATIENTIYIVQGYLNALQMGVASDPVSAAFGTAAVRSFAGPGHVIYSAFAGYYLGLAKFNRENAGPIVVKGLLIAAFIHATYNTAVSYLPGLVALAGVGLSPAVAFLGFVVIYDGVFGYALYRKIARYRRTYRETGAGHHPATDEGSEPEADGEGGGDDPEPDAGTGTDVEGADATETDEGETGDEGSADGEWEWER